MPRQAHGRSLSSAGSSRPPKHKPTRSRNLDAFAIAEKENSTKIRVRRNRLGEIEEDSHDRNLLAKRDQNEGEHPAKRRRIHGQDSSTDEDRAGSGSDGEEWHLGVDNDDDDSDLDSDEAMGASDEEKFEGFAFRGTSAQKSKRLSRKIDSDGMKNSKDVDLQESSHEDASDDYENQSSDEDGLGEDAVDLATALDMNEENGKEKEQRQRKSSTVATQDLRDTRYTDDSNGSSEDDTSASEDAHSTLSLSDDEDLGANHTRLQSFVQGLEIPAPSDAASKRIRPPIAVGEPSDYGLASSQKLTVSDLLSTVTDPRLRESLKMLHNSEQKPSTTSTKGIPGKLEPPLPKRQQDRLDREAAYERSKETLSRWIDTVKQNRRAEHISFPLSDPNALAALGTNQLMPASHLEAVTPLESVIQSIMHESGLASKNDPSAEEKEQAFEELQERKMPIEEVQFRRAELRKARDLMFREEIRARRINKIKSKAYRRVHRKERDKHAQEAHAALAAAGALDSEKERERQDRRRAEERMGARHKESKWAKGVKATGRAVWDEDARSGLGDLGRKDEELRKRIEGKEPTQSDKIPTDSSDEESSDNISIDEYDEVEGLKLTQKLGDLEAVKQTNPSESRLSSMPFMRKAEAARRAANEADIDETRRILAGEEAEVEDKEKSLAETGGRRRFGLGQQGQTERAHRTGEKNEFEEPQPEDETRPARLTGKQMSQPAHDVLPKNPANVRKVTAVESGGRKKEQDMCNDNDNPWLSGPRSRKSGHMTDGPIISTKDSLQVQKTASNEFKSRQMTSKTRVVRPSTMEDLTSPSESEAESPGKYAGHEQSSRRNEELVRMAFAGDDVFQAFTDEKKAIMDEEGDQIVDTTLPGWGSWTGAGISKKELRRANSLKSTTTVKGIHPTKRKDAKLDRVIINEKRVKKVGKRHSFLNPNPTVLMNVLECQISGT
jgi:U3 small nucleolar RNA-associated protein 14